MITSITKPDPKRASLTLYLIVALNTGAKLESTINKTVAAQVLADLLQIDRRAPLSWLRGDFKKHPISRENFLRFIRTYRTKPGLENVKEITTLAINLYGSDYKKAIDLLDPADRERELSQDVQVTPSSKSNLVTAICNLLESSPSEEVEIALVTLIAYRWSTSNSYHRNFLM